MGEATKKRGKNLSGDGAKNVVVVDETLRCYFSHFLLLLSSLRTVRLSGGKKKNTFFPPSSCCVSIVIGRVVMVSNS